MNGRLTLESLHYAHAVADTGSFSAAARRFGVTQPALSLSIAKLEEHLGGRLFLRNPRGTVPTAFGQALLPRIAQVVVGIERLAVDAETFTSTRSGTVRAGVSPQIDKEIVAQLRDAVHGPDALQPGRDLMLLESELDPLEDQLRSGNLDMLVIPALGKLPGYSHRLIDSDYLVLVEPDDEGTEVSRAARGPVSVEDIADREFILSRHGCGITRMAEDIFREAGHKLVLSDVVVTNCSTLLGWADKGMGSVLLPERNVAPEFRSRRLVRGDGTLVEMFYEVTWDPGARDAVYLELLADILATAVSSDA